MSDYEWFFKKKEKIINYKNLLRNVINIGGEKKERKEWRNKKRKYNSLRLDVVWVFVLVSVVEVVIGYNLIMYKTQS